MFFKTAIIKKSIVFSLVIFMATSVMAQMVPPTQPQPQELPSDYTDQELKKFVSAVVQVMAIQEEGQMQMVEAIEENNITIDRFNEMLMQGQQMGQENIEATEDELVAFTNSMNEVQMVQMEMQQNMMAAITEEGLDVEQYQNIMQSYEVNPEIKEKVDQYFEELEP